MRTMLKIHLYTCAFIMISLAVLNGFAEDNNHHELRAIISIFCVAYAFTSICISLFLTPMGLNKVWFQSQDELYNSISEAKEELRKARKFCHILGEHEGVKLWKEAQEKKEKV